MTLQTSGPISLDDVNVEITTKSSGDQISLNDSDVRGLTPNSTYADALHGPGINTTSGSIISSYELYGASGAVPTYTALNRSAATVNEGSSVSFTVTTSGITNGTTVGYTVTGISSADLSSGSLTGNITINSNTGSVTFGIANDYLTEGSETLTITLAATDSAGNATGSLSSSAVINDTSTSLTVSISGTMNGSVAGCYNSTITSSPTSGSTGTATTSVSGGSGGYTYYWEVAGGVYNTSGMVATASSFTNGRFASSNGATITGYASPVSASGSSGSTYVPNIKVTVTDSVGNTATASTTGNHTFSWYPATGYIYPSGYFCSGYDLYYTYATDDCGNTATALDSSCSPSCTPSLSVSISGSFSGSVSGPAGSSITATSGNVYAVPSGGSGGYSYQWSLVSYNDVGVTATAAYFGSGGGGGGQVNPTTGSVTATRSTAGSGYVDVVVSVTVTDNCGNTASTSTSGTYNFTFT